MYTQEGDAKINKFNFKNILNLIVCSMKFKLYRLCNYNLKIMIQLINSISKTNKHSSNIKILNQIFYKMMKMKIYLSINNQI